MNEVAKPLTHSSASVALAPAGEELGESDSLFERFAWIYIFCRKHVFRDDSERMIRALWSGGRPPPNTRLLELGCGPGFYSQIMAKRFPNIAVLGIDRSKRQLEYACSRAERCGLINCTFERGNVLDLMLDDEAFSEVIASRLFTVVPGRERAISEMFRVLRSGGRCFVAEPRFAFSASIPLVTMRLLARLSGYAGEYREPTRAIALSHGEFQSLLATQPWSELKTWCLGRYQYALCKKD